MDSWLLPMMLLMNQNHNQPVVQQPAPAAPPKIILLDGASGRVQAAPAGSIPSPSLCPPSRSHLSGRYRRSAGFGLHGEGTHSIHYLVDPGCEEWRYRDGAAELCCRGPSIHRSAHLCEGVSLLLGLLPSHLPPPSPTHDGADRGCLLRAAADDRAAGGAGGDARPGRHLGRPHRQRQEEGSACPSPAPPTNFTHSSPFQIKFMKALMGLGKDDKDDTSWFG